MKPLRMMHEGLLRAPGAQLPEAAAGVFGQQLLVACNL